MLAVTELVDRLGVVSALDEAVGPIKQRARGLTGGEFLVGLASAQLAGEDYLVGLDRRRADTAGGLLAPVATAPSTTAATLAKRFDRSAWHSVEAAIGIIGGRVMGHLGPRRRAALLAAPTLDIDATEVEVYGARKQGVAYNYKGQRAGRPHLATWAPFIPSASTHACSGTAAAARQVAGLRFAPMAKSQPAAMTAWARSLVK